MRFTSAALLLTLITAVTASGLSGRHHEDGDEDSHANSTMSMSMSGSKTQVLPSSSAASSSAAAASSILAAAAAASSSSAAGNPVTRPGALTGALALALAMVV